MKAFRRRRRRWLYTQDAIISRPERVGTRLHTRAAAAAAVAGCIFKRGAPTDDIATATGRRANRLAVSVAVTDISNGDAYARASVDRRRDAVQITRCRRTTNISRENGPDADGRNEVSAGDYLPYSGHDFRRTEIAIRAVSVRRHFGRGNVSAGDTFVSVGRGEGPSIIANRTGKSV